MEMISVMRSALYQSKKLWILASHSVEEKLRSKDSKRKKKIKNFTMNAMLITVILYK